jgi:hypothetical protein
MKQNGYLVLAIASIIGAVAMFALFIMKMTSEEFLNPDGSVFIMILSILAYIGLASMFMLLSALFFIKYYRAKNGAGTVFKTKKCVSCGTEMDIMEMSCPRCFTLQPPDQHRILRVK